MIGYLKLGGLLVAGAALAGLLWIVHGWRVDAAQKPVLEARAIEAEAYRDGYLEAAQLAARAAMDAEQRVLDGATVASRVKVIYREAQRVDPDCAAWSALPVQCPLGLPVGAGTAATEHLPGNTAIPDP